MPFFHTLQVHKRAYGVLLRAGVGRRRARATRTFMLVSYRRRLHLNTQPTLRPFARDPGASVGAAPPAGTGDGLHASAQGAE